MAENSKIGWTDHTHNFWWGCTKVSEECRHCYIDGIMRRAGRSPFGGPIRTVDWSKPHRWEKQARKAELQSLIGPSAYDSVFDNPLAGRPDKLMEGLYLRTEAKGVVTGRAKIVRPEFVEKVKQSEHWQHMAMVPNVLASDAELWS